MSHHGDPETMRRFLDQMQGKAKREYPKGRMGAEDEGALSFAIATDPRHQTIIIRFGKPVEWVGLGLEEARQLKEMLTQKILELQGIV